MTDLRLTPTRKELLRAVADGKVSVTLRGWYLGPALGFARPSTQRWLVEQGLVRQMSNGGICVTAAGTRALSA